MWQQRVARRRRCTPTHRRPNSSTTSSSSGPPPSSDSESSSAAPPETRKGDDRSLSSCSTDNSHHHDDDPPCSTRGSSHVSTPSVSSVSHCSCGDSSDPVSAEDAPPLLLPVSSWEQVRTLGTAGPISPDNVSVHPTDSRYPAAGDNTAGTHRSPDDNAAATCNAGRTDSPSSPIEVPATPVVSPVVVEVVAPSSSDDPATRDVSPKTCKTKGGSSTTTPSSTAHEETGSVPHQRPRVRSGNVPTQQRTFARKQWTNTILISQQKKTDEAVATDPPVVSPPTTTTETSDRAVATNAAAPSYDAMVTETVTTEHVEDRHPHHQTSAKIANQKDSVVTVKQEEQPAVAGGGGTDKTRRRRSVFESLFCASSMLAASSPIFELHRTLLTSVAATARQLGAATDEDDRDVSRPTRDEGGGWNATDETQGVVSQHEVAPPSSPRKRCQSSADQLLFGRQRRRRQAKRKGSCDATLREQQSGPTVAAKGLPPPRRRALSQRIGATEPALKQQQQYAQPFYLRSPDPTTLPIPKSLFWVRGDTCC